MRALFGISFLCLLLFTGRLGYTNSGAVEFVCHADSELFPFLGKIHAYSQALVIQSRNGPDISFNSTRYEVRRYQNLSGSSLIWDAGKKILAVARRPSAFGPYYNGTLELKDSGEQHISLWCYKQ